MRPPLIVISIPRKNMEDRVSMSSSYGLSSCLSFIDDVMRPPLIVISIPRKNMEDRVSMSSSMTS